MGADLLWDPDVPVGQRRLARRPVPAAPGTTEVVLARARAVAATLPLLGGLALAALALLLWVDTTAAGSWLVPALVSVLAVLAVAGTGAVGLATAREVAAVRRAHRVADAVRSARARAVSVALDPATVGGGLAEPVAELAGLQRVAEDLDPAVRSVVEQAAAGVLARVAADRDLWTESAAARRVVSAGDPGDADVAELAERLARVPAARDRLGAEVRALVGGAAGAVAAAGRRTATVDATRLRALGGLDDALAAARGLTDTRADGRGDAVGG